MRTVAFFVAIAGCTEQIYTPGFDTGTATTAPVSPALQSGSAEWAAGACEPVRLPARAIVQLMVCNDMADGMRQCWPDPDARLTVIDDTAYVAICADERTGPDAFVLTWIAAS